MNYIYNINLHRLQMAYVFWKYYNIITTLEHLFRSYNQRQNKAWLKYISAPMICTERNFLYLHFLLLPAFILTQNTPLRSSEKFLGKTKVMQSYTFDFFNYAGIHRSVFLYSTPQVYIEDVIVNTDIQGLTGEWVQ